MKKQERAFLKKGAPKTFALGARGVFDNRVSGAKVFRGAPGGALP